MQLNITQIHWLSNPREREITSRLRGPQVPFRSQPARPRPPLNQCVNDLLWCSRMCSEHFPKWSWDLYHSSRNKIMTSLDWSRYCFAYLCAFVWRRLLTRPSKALSALSRQKSRSDVSQTLSLPRNSPAFLRSSHMQLSFDTAYRNAKGYI